MTRMNVGSSDPETEWLRRVHSDGAFLKAEVARAKANLDPRAPIKCRCCEHIIKPTRRARRFDQLCSGEKGRHCFATFERWAIENKVPHHPGFVFAVGGIRSSSWVVNPYRLEVNLVAIDAWMVARGGAPCACVWQASISNKAPAVIALLDRLLPGLNNALP